MEVLYRTVLSTTTIKVLSLVKSGKLNASKGSNIVKYKIYLTSL
jgi:hypothetical protein